MRGNCKNPVPLFTLHFFFFLFLINSSVRRWNRRREGKGNRQRGDPFADSGQTFATGNNTSRRLAVLTFLTRNGNPGEYRAGGRASQLRTRGYNIFIHRLRRHCRPSLFSTRIDLLRAPFLHLLLLHLVLSSPRKSCAAVAIILKSIKCHREFLPWYT